MPIEVVHLVDAAAHVVLDLLDGRDSVRAGEEQTRPISDAMPSRYSSR